MASWRVSIVDIPDETVEVFVDLIDTVGPVNDCSFADKAAFLTSSGTFTNQTDNVSLAAGVCVLRKFDIDAVKVHDVGSGSVELNNGTFPNGEIKWFVSKKL